MWNVRLDVLETVLRHMAPSSADRPAPYRSCDVGFARIVNNGWGQRLAIPVDHRLDHPCGRDTRQVQSPRRGFEWQAEADEIVDWIDDDGLIQTAYLDVNVTIGISHRLETAKTVTANPHYRTFGIPAATRNFSSH